MNIRIASAVIAIAIGLSACASTSSNMHSSVVYRDGSYYSPAEAGRGDYYYAPEPREDDYFGYDPFFFGGPFYSFGGYCSVAYRTCPPYWYGALYDPWYDPFWGSTPYYYHHHHRSQSSTRAPDPLPAKDDSIAGNDAADRPNRPRPRWHDEDPARASHDTFPVRTRDPVLHSQASGSARPHSGRRDEDRGGRE